MQEPRDPVPCVTEQGPPHESREAHEPIDMQRCVHGITSEEVGPALGIGPTLANGEWASPRPGHAGWRILAFPSRAVRTALIRASILNGLWRTPDAPRRMAMAPIESSWTAVITTTGRVQFARCSA